MKDDYLNYGKFIDEAMYSVIRNALRTIVKHGLRAKHHFFITFDTKHSGVMMSDELRRRYPDEMTIVIQHQFWNLEVEESRFSIVLSFDDVKQNITVPFESLISFVDPSVKFGLQFHHEEIVGKKPEPEQLLADLDNKNTKGTKDTKKVSNVVALDSFRKNK